MDPTCRPCINITVQQVLAIERPDPTALAVGEILAETKQPMLADRDATGRVATQQLAATQELSGTQELAPLRRPQPVDVGLFDGPPLSWAPELCQRRPPASSPVPISPVTISPISVPFTPMPLAPQPTPLDLSFVGPGPNRLKNVFAASRRAIPTPIIEPRSYESPAPAAAPSPSPSELVPVRTTATALLEPEALPESEALPEPDAKVSGDLGPFDGSLFDEALGLDTHMSIPGSRRPPAFLAPEPRRVLEANPQPSRSRQRRRQSIGAMVVGFLTRSMVAFSIALVSFAALRFGGIV